MIILAAISSFKKKITPTFVLRKKLIVEQLLVDTNTNFY